MSLVNRGEENSQQEGTVEVAQDNNEYFIQLIIWGVILFVIFAFALWGKFGYKAATMNTLYIDNPTDTEVQVQINDNEVLTIAPNSHQEIKLGAGTYTLKIDGEDKGEFTKGKFDGKAFLNPTKSIYIKETAIYTNKEKFDTSNYVDIEIDGEIYYGPFVKYDDYYVNSWAIYGLDEELPEETSIGKKSETYLSKIYRLDDFLPMYYERYYDWYDYDDYYYDDEDYEDVE